ncbi:BrnT family toxin [Nodularia spumigena CS-584]|jgi:uncharacterized DUF497 family protein|uniref:BrnT family toxin n=1 Tax=Nodularia spumigena UHCC 0060 TaxID=3110300 RepID=A0ABU5UWW5_NODSP|nr:BrnT family toxin [Nodularia spumigena]AHJ28213.1 hypothetical protein NSP_18800 [Nodularia spumigena CCY9414]EAW46046.1 hypothetical protein N9414_10443 [Nodularia spumigena CCY9414]MDB9381701.1 BrnT family toxin [Nodularia spumigena CS-584]MEA5523981.1 BrnT family toxin [Nodularia spumigena UHCC 0143]MEA5558901.1 BrnT family toxin [Nodularia spumigena CH309]
MEFKWDESKAAINLKKHNVSFEEAKTVFDKGATRFCEMTLLKERSLKTSFSRLYKLVTVKAVLILIHLFHKIL